jgi:hypothetical protein
VSLRSEFRVVMSVTISAQTRCSFPLKPQLFVGGLISYLRFLYLHERHIIGQHKKLNIITTRTTPTKPGSNGYSLIIIELNTHGRQDSCREMIVIRN